MSVASQRNVLWIMCDQFRHDYMSCAGHPHLETPTLDWLAATGVRFTRAYAQSPICSASRVSAYTGRYLRSHGASGNEVPISIGSLTLGDYLSVLGADTVLIGKTHMRGDVDGMKRLGIEPQSGIGVHLAEAGFHPYERHDGLHPDGPYDPDPSYNAYLRSQGLDAENPWEAYANSAEAPGGSIVSGWLMENANLPARVPAEHSETAWITNRAMDFMAERAGNDRPWCLHLSYIKPHWPYLAPAPYHAMYDRTHVVPAMRNEAERFDPNPLYAAFMRQRYSTVFSRDEVRDRVVPAYMGLIKEVDDQLSRLFAYMGEKDLLERTLIVFTADHGDYLGDHWLGEKYLFHDPSVRIPMIVRDPRREADTTRGGARDDLVELIDLLPTILDFVAGREASRTERHRLQGRSLVPILVSGVRPDAWRGAVFSEYDYAYDAARNLVGTAVDDSCATMVFDGRWKYVHVPENPPLLHDLLEDPYEYNDLGRDPRFGAVVSRMRERMFDWCRRQHGRTTVTEAEILDINETALSYDYVIDQNIFIGYWDSADVAEEKRKRGVRMDGERSPERP